MKILILYANKGGYGRIPLGMSIIATLWKNAGHEVEVFDTTFMGSGNQDAAKREASGFVQPPAEKIEYDGLTESNIGTVFLAKLITFRPNLIATTIVEDNYEYTHHFLKIAKRYDDGITTLAGGSVPTVAPGIVMQNPYIDSVIVGEGEDAALQFTSIGMTREVQNLFYKIESDIVYSNALGKYIDMNTLPIQDLSLWDERHLLKPYHGKLVKAGYYELSRGCPYGCSYCINHSLREQLKDCGKYIRRKKPEVLVDEICYHKTEYGIEHVFFCDDNFLAIPKEDLDELAMLWLKEVNLPFWFNTDPLQVTPKKMQVVKAMGCDGISTSLESGSPWMRQHVLHRNINSNKFLNAIGLIKEFGIKTTTNVMIGFPSERESDIQMSIDVMKQAQVDSLNVSIVIPYYGTKIHKVASQLRMISQKNEPGFVGLAEGAFAREACMRLNEISQERLVYIRDHFMDYVNGKGELLSEHRDEVRKLMEE